MKKLKQKLRVVVSIVLVIAALGSTAAIFGLSRAPDDIGSGIVLGSVGYMNGIQRGSGKYAANNNTYTFPSTFVESGELSYGSAYSFINGFHGQAGDPLNTGNPTTSLDGYKIAEDDEGYYLSLTTCDEDRGRGLIVPFAGTGGNSIANRHGLYTVEFDMMIPEAPNVSGNKKETKFARLDLLGHGLNSSYNNGQVDISGASTYSSFGLFDTGVDGYYTISAWGEVKDALKNIDIMLKYGEWYNVRLTYYIPGGTGEGAISYDYRIEINGQEVFQTNNATYNMCHKKTGTTTTIFNTYVKSFPVSFAFVPMNQVHGSTFNFDNFYCRRDYQGVSGLPSLTEKE